MIPSAWILYATRGLPSIWLGVDDDGDADDDHDVNYAVFHLAQFVISIIILVTYPLARCPQLSEIYRVWPEDEMDCVWSIFYSIVWSTN